MSTPVFIMAVPFDPRRAVNAKRLADETGGTVVWDEKQSIVDTFLRLLEAAGDGPAIFMQDDVRLTSRWREKVEEVIAEHPDAVCQFFSIRKADLTLGARWERGSAYLMNQCWYAPPTYAAQLRVFAEKWFDERPGHTGDDTCVGEFLKSRRERYWHHVPSLVQHNEWVSAVSQARSSKRLSPTFEEHA